MLHRRTNKVNGYINFPVDSKEFVSTGEGGLYVELWVVPVDNKDWMVCCGGVSISSFFSGSLVGTDKERNKDNYDRFGDSFDKEQRFPLEEELFPNIKDDNHRSQYESKSLHACVTLGSTGWSGYSDEKGMWRCTFDDLTEDGKNLYGLMKKLYGDKAELLLVTWLDT